MSDEKAPQPLLFAGLDLGPVQDPTALAVLERTLQPDPARPGKTRTHYAVRHLHRYQAGTPYATIVADVAWLFHDPPLRGSVLAVDQTGVGRPVVDLLHQARLHARLSPLTLSTGHRGMSGTGGEWLVPKKDVVASLQVLLQSRRLIVSPALAEAQTLVQELETFRMKATLATDESSVAWREGRNDDLVLAVAVAVWEGELYREWKGYWF
jgi:hypothetical protein